MSPNQSAAACLKTSGDASSCIPQPRAIPDSRSHEPEPVSSGLSQDLRGHQQLSSAYYHAVEAATNNANLGIYPLR